MLWAAAGLCGVVATTPSLAQDALGRYRFQAPGRLVQLASIQERGAAGSPGSVLVSLRDLVSGLGGTLQTADASGERFVTIAGTSLCIPSDQPAVLVGAQRVLLSRAARRIGGDLYLPLDFLTKVVDPILKAARSPAQPTSTAAPLATVAPPSSGIAAVTVPAPAVAAATAPQPPAGAAKPSTAAPPTPAPAPPPGTRAPIAGAVAGAAAGKTPLAPPAFTIVLDPGHGGSETGAEGRRGADGAPGIYEKDITLDIARRLRTLLQGQPSIHVLLTRDDDALVTLDQRTALANQNHADLFLSIHVNSAPRHEARGAETYFLSYASKDEDVRTLAAIENNAAGVDKEKLGEAPQGLELVLWDLAQSQYLQESGALAGSIQKELNEALGARDRGVRQAPFRVLMGATMPAVLVEVGFLSNPAEETSLATEEYRDKIAQALSRAVTAFLADATRRMGAAAARTR